MGHHKSCCERTLSVVGEGIASLIFLHDLAHCFEKGLTLPFSKIIWARAPKLVSSASFWSTALVAPHGVKTGLSPLGDELFEAFSLAREFYQQWSGPGVEKISLTYFEDEKNSIERRFGKENLSAQRFENFQAQGFQEEAFLINPEIFLAHLKQKILQLLPNIEIVEDVILSFSDSKLVGLKNSYPCDQVFWGSGINPFGPKKGKAISGHVLRFDDIDLGAKSFALNILGKNLIYRADQTGRVLFVGATSSEDGEMFPDAQSLLDYLQRLQAIKEFAFLRNHKAILWGGPRHKLSKRRPQIQAVNAQEFHALGFYKSGYSLAHLAAHKARAWWQA